MQFQSISLKDRAAIKAYEPYVIISDHSFTSLYTWADQIGFQYAIINGYLCISGVANGQTCVHAPIGAYDPESYQQTMDILYEKFHLPEIGLRVVIATEDAVERMQVLKGFSVTGGEMSPNRFDYIYDMQNFIHMEGKANHERRRFLRRLFETHTTECQQITAENVSTCMDIMNDWCSRRDCALCTMGCEKKVIQRAVDAFDALELNGCMTKIDGTPMSFALAEQLGDMTIIIFAKTAKILDGLTDYTFTQLCTNKYADAKILNLCEDEGMEGLRRFKRRLGEWNQIKKYQFILKK